MVLIVIDGLDASGKNTQALSLYNFLKTGGKTVCMRIHPSTDNFFGTKAKAFLYSKGKSAHFATAIFYMADVIRSVLLYSWRKYDYTIFVRYLMGTAYLRSPLDRIGYYFFTCIVPTSDLMFFLDVHPREADRRIRQTRRRKEMFESLEELNRIRGKALSLALSDRWTILDADKPPRDIETEIKNVLSLRSHTSST